MSGRHSFSDHAWTSNIIPTWWLVSWDFMWPIGGELVTTITYPSCWGTHFLYLSNPPSGNLLPIIPCSRHTQLQTRTTRAVDTTQQIYKFHFWSWAWGLCVVWSLAGWNIPPLQQSWCLSVCHPLHCPVLDHCSCRVKAAVLHAARGHCRVPANTMTGAMATVSTLRPGTWHNFVPGDRQQVTESTARMWCYGEMWGVRRNENVCSSLPGWWSGDGDVCCLLPDLDRFH